MYIRANLPSSIEEELIKCMKDNINICVVYLENIFDINPMVAYHLNIDPYIKIFFNKRQRQSKEKA